MKGTSKSFLALVILVPFTLSVAYMFLRGFLSIFFDSEIDAIQLIIIVGGGFASCAMLFRLLAGGILEASREMIGELRPTTDRRVVKELQKTGQVVSIYDLAQELGENPSTISYWCKKLNIKSKYLNVEQTELIRNYRIMILDGLKVK